MSATRQAIAKSLLVLALLWNFNGCAYPTKRAEPQPPQPPPVVVEPAPEFMWEIPAERVLPPPPPKPKPRPYVHEVRWSGEILISIAKWYTGSRNNWTAIAKANPHLNPNRIFIGDNILIPENLLKRRDPMPLKFLVTSSHKKPAQTPPPKQPSVESYAIELFKPEITEQSSPESDTTPLFEPIE
jgi:hypothetical protein